ncbi:hypothetical protein GCM10029992_55930 [Glycomyces albus]
MHTVGGDIGDRSELAEIRQAQLQPLGPETQPVDREVVADHDSDCAGGAVHGQLNKARLDFRIVMCNIFLT